VLLELERPRTYRRTDEHPLRPRQHAFSYPRGRNVAGASKCIGILRCDPRIQYKGFYRLTHVSRAERVSPRSLPLSLSLSRCRRHPFFSHPDARFRTDRVHDQFTMQLLQRAMLYRIMFPIKHLCNVHDMQSALRAL